MPLKISIFNLSLATSAELAENFLKRGALGNIRRGASHNKRVDAGRRMRDRILCGDRAPTFLVHGPKQAVCMLCHIFFFCEDAVSLCHEIENIFFYGHLEKYKAKAVDVDFFIVRVPTEQLRRTIERSPDRRLTNKMDD
jgi:hypothetical protein